MKKDMPENEDGWKQMLTPEQYAVLREKGTEAPFSGEYVHEKADGTYVCYACGNPLFDSSAKFDSGTGWPSFDSALPGAVETHVDNAHGMVPPKGVAISDQSLRSWGNRERTEITCARCGSHLGHIFDDGPTKTGKRYCVNSVCLDLEEK